MSEKFKIKLMELTTYILIIICIFALYKLYSRPVSLNNVINNDSIKSIFVRIIVNDIKDYEVSDEQDIKLDKDEDIDEFISILNKYKYSKIPKFYNDRVFPVNYSDVTIDCVINYDDNKILHQQVQIYSNNEVTMYNKKGKYRDYVVKGNEEKLFKELLMWIDERY